VVKDEIVAAAHVSQKVKADYDLAIKLRAKGKPMAPGI
jgi:hypothetical protein